MADSAASLEPEPPLVLRPSKLKWAGIAAGCLCFLAPVGLVIAAGAGSFTWMGWVAVGVIALIIGGFFGLGFFIAVGMLVWPGNRLEIDDDGFTLWSFVWQQRIAWRDTWGIHAGAGGMVCTVAVDLPEIRLVELPYGYGRTAADLACIMNERRARADAREGFGAVRRRDAELWGFW